MVFLPPGVTANTATKRRDEKELIEEVRNIAAELAASLSGAGQLTEGWSHRKLADTLIDAALSHGMARLARLDCWGEANRLPSGELWRIAGPILEVGTLQHHARFKPYGYAGDHVMLTRICEESRCDHALGSLFDGYFLRQAAPEAVRARTEHAATALVAHRLRHPRERYRVVSVGSGPAIDVARAVAVLPDLSRTSLSIRLLDLDPAALDAARKRLEPWTFGDRVACVRTNLYRLAQGSRGARELEQPDFLICTGFFDYLDDGAAAALLNLFWRQLAEGGELLVGNFAPHNPSRAYMEWIGNWYLKYRTLAQMRALALAAEIPEDRFRIGCDRTGVDLFIVAWK